MHLTKSCDSESYYCCVMNQQYSFLESAYISKLLCKNVHCKVPIVRFLQMSSKRAYIKFIIGAITIFYYLTYSRIKCQIYTHSKENLRNYFITFICCYLLSFILIEVCTLQIKSLSLLF